MSPRLSGNRQRLFASSSAVLSPFSETATPACEKQLSLKFDDHHETPRRSLLPTFCRCLNELHVLSLIFLTWNFHTLFSGTLFLSCHHPITLRFVLYCL
jgi:hypothetical protein